VIRVFSDEWISQSDRIRELLRDRQLFKSLSISISSAAGLPIPDTIVLLSETSAAIQECLRTLGSPLMLRMDFERLPRRKMLGGIPVFEASNLSKLCQTLFTSECIPLLQCYSDRFRDLYSVNLLMAEAGDDVTLEVVGRGFDAGDLRLGMSTPHERISIDIFSGKIAARHKILEDRYRIERNERLLRIRGFQSYICRANQDGVLSHDLPKATSPQVTDDIEHLVPGNYSPLGLSSIRELLGMAQRIKFGVIPALPHSMEYSASFSLVPTGGWKLWDIYGSWYNR